MILSSRGWAALAIIAYVAMGTFMRPHVDFTSALYHSRDILSEVVIGYTLCVEYFKLVTMYSFKYLTCLFVSISLLEVIIKKLALVRYMV